MKEFILERMKAVVGAIVTGLGSLSVAISDDHITTQEWITVAIATLTALGGVWVVTNEESVSTLRAKLRRKENS